MNENAILSMGLGFVSGLICCVLLVVALYLIYKGVMWACEATEGMLSRWKHRNDTPVKFESILSEETKIEPIQFSKDGETARIISEKKRAEFEELLRDNPNGFRKVDSPKNGKLLGSVHQHKHHWYFDGSTTVHDPIGLCGVDIYHFSCRCEEERAITAKDFWGSPTILHERQLAFDERMYKNKKLYEEQIALMQSWGNGSGSMRGSIS